MVEETIEAKEKQLDDLVQEVYGMYERHIEPTYPWVLVRIMPKEQKIGSIYAPLKQNKTFYEGIVLATWKPWWRHYQGDLKFDEEGESKIVGKSVLEQSSVEPGDRVLFMHFEGQPAPFLGDEHHYRMIHERETHVNGGIWAKVVLAEDDGLREKLNKLFHGKTCCSVSGK